MRKFAVAVAVLGSLAFAGGAVAGGRWVITNMNQIKPSLRNQLRGNAGRAGSQGPAGPAGPVGPAGIPGVVEVESAPGILTPDGVSGVFASCPAGYVALGGGWDGAAAPPISATVAYDDPIGNNTAWDVVMADDGSSISSTIAAVVECAPAPAGAAIAHVSRSTVQREASQALTAVRDARAKAH